MNIISKTPQIGDSWWLFATFIYFPLLLPLALAFFLIARLIGLLMSDPPMHAGKRCVWCFFFFKCMLVRNRMSSRMLSSSHAPLCLLPAAIMPQTPHGWKDNLISGSFRVREGENGSHGWAHFCYWVWKDLHLLNARLWLTNVIFLVNKCINVAWGVEG